ncbi:MAG: biotin--[acetyl-CoA-carboxylase] ligase [Tissierellia bacterium]|nr:biotin--[acetyl-CoA-carboxylase] ligase [Tissierellia bacterium]MDD3226170.1 biotin--[acetyl-CoA-carboxylase] ligase [Tissierellia bacterium]MDD4045505.1 biotin--[acetyl-CoA-carboxylase] ligase [Tissierellia bacterium]MDD4677874.1 biotin--[acetyl-CoA-carboxylase] ligase [Tissierellia bacterium]
MYDLNSISSYLNTNIIGQSIIQYDNLNSTFAKAKNVFATCPDGTVVLSENQSECVSRFGNEWFCFPDKNIYLSIILKSVNNNYLLPITDVVGCSSILSSIEELYNLDCRIRWPNDILINDNKIASVKSDIIGKGAGIILSLNINVNMEENIKNLKTTSVKLEKGEDVERELLIATILNKIEYHYDEMINTGKAFHSVEIYNKNLLFYNKEVGVIKRGRKKVREVVAKNIDSDGWLAVINEKGEEEFLSPGDTIIQYEET